MNQEKTASVLDIKTIPAASFLDIPGIGAPRGTYEEKVSEITEALDHAKSPPPKELVIALLALHYESIAIINRLVRVVEKTDSPDFQKSAEKIINRWESSVEQASVILSEKSVPVPHRTSQVRIARP